jgi:hypothetical protein
MILFLTLAALIVTSFGLQGALSQSSKRVYERQYATETPVFIKNSVYIQAATQKQYWKFPNVKNYSSWAPKVRFNLFFDDNPKKVVLSYTAEYFNPDGSPWFKETLENGGDRFTSNPANTYQTLQTKSTAATGTYGVKITDKSGEVIFQGKFKVGKFLPPYSEKNEFDFFVDHDWLLPIGYVGFEQRGELDDSLPVVSVWLKDTIEPKELEARLFFKGQQIATTANDGGGVIDVGERASEFAALSAPLHYWKLWHFRWHKFRFANGGSLNRYPDAIYADESPGEYTVKVYRNGAQVRETKFTVGADGRFVDAGYAKPIFIPYYRVIIPVKVVGTTEKWDALAWKTDAFYGNPMTGFSVP